MPQVPPQQTERRNGAATNGSNGVNGNHYPPALMLPLPAPPPSEAEGGLDMPGIWNAFRRRWFLAIGLGLLFGVPAAIGTWSVAPAPYVSFVELRMNSLNSEAFPGSRDKQLPNFDVWKQTALKRATHPDVLKNAWEISEVRTASMIREHEPHVLPWLEETLVIKPTGQEYFRIELEGEQPQELADILNAVAAALVENIDVDRYREKTLQKQQSEKLLSESTRLIETNRTELDRIRGARKPSPAEVGRRQTFLLELQSKLRAALLEIELAKVQLELQPHKTDGGRIGNKDVDQYVEQMIDGNFRFLEAEGEVSSHERQIHDLERYIKHQSDTLSPTHPELVAAQKQLENLKGKLNELTENVDNVRKEIKAEIEASLSEEMKKSLDPEDDLETSEKVLRAKFEATGEELNAKIEEINKQNEELDLYSAQADRITEVIDREKERQVRFQDEVERLQFELDNSPKLVEVSRKAEAPHERSLKKKTMLSGAAGFGVFGFFIAGIVFLEYRTRRIATLNQVSETLNLRVMGTVPLLPRSAASGQTVKKKAKNSLWYSALTEAIDSTRTILIRGSQVEALKTIMVASATGGEGKTTLASHLATSLARGGRKILLVDGDLRRPCMHRAFDLPAGQGVCEVLRGEADIADCIQELNSPAGLSVLPAGKINQQVLKELALGSLGELLKPLKQEYDFIIIDSSPLLPVTDGLLVAQHVDGVILSIRRDISRVGKVVMACQKLSMLGIPLLGAVTIGLQEESHYYKKSAYKTYSNGNGQYYYNQPPA